MVTVARTPVLHPAGGYPNATNTGTTGSLTLVDPFPLIFNRIETPGILLEDLDFRGSVFFDEEAVGATMRNCRVLNHSPLNFTCVAIHALATGVTIEDCELDGGPFDTGAGVGMQDGCTVRRTNIHSVENGISSGADNITIADNFIHDLTVTGATPHYDGIQSSGGHSNWVIRHNTIRVPGQTAAVFIANDDGATDQVLIEDNLLEGGTYTIYVDDQFSASDITNVTVRNNRLGVHTFGYYFIREDPPGPTITFTGNVDHITGAPVPET
jgi:hypothetical protein